MRVVCENKGTACLYLCIQLSSVLQHGHSLHWGCIACGQHGMVVMAVNKGSGRSKLAAAPCADLERA